MRVAALAVVVLLAGCSLRQEAAETALVVSAKDKVKRVMKDPESVQFKDVRVVQLATAAGNAPIVCGEVNAKNGFGGYAGYEQFAWHPDGKLLLASAYPVNGQEAVNAGIASLCRGRVPDAPPA